jgi:hypothetical protein
LPRAKNPARKRRDHDNDVGTPIKKLKTSHSSITHDLVPPCIEPATSDANLDEESVGLEGLKVHSFVDLTRDKDAQLYDEEPLDFRGEDNFNFPEVSHLMSHLTDGPSDESSVAGLSLDENFLENMDFMEGEFNELLMTDITIPSQPDTVMSVPSTVTLPSRDTIEHPSIGAATVTPEEEDDSKNVQGLDNTAANQLAFPVSPQHVQEEEELNETAPNKNVVVAQVRFSSSASERTYIDQQDIAPNDILCGREFTGTKHEGNKIFLVIVRERRAIYDSYGLVHGSKTELTRDLLDNAIQGRFIVKEKRSGRLFLKTRSEARQKVSQAFRDARRI